MWDGKYRTGLGCPHLYKRRTSRKVGSRSRTPLGKGPGTQIHLGPPESRGSGGAVPRPIEGESPRPSNKHTSPAEADPSRCRLLTPDVAGRVPSTRTSTSRCLPDAPSSESMANAASWPLGETIDVPAGRATPSQTRAKTRMRVMFEFAPARHHRSLLRAVIRVRPGATRERRGNAGSARHRHRLAGDLRNTRCSHDRQARCSTRCFTRSPRSPESLADGRRPANTHVSDPGDDRTTAQAR